MNIQDAISTALKGLGQDREAWFRPVSYIGTGHAFCAEDGRLCKVPGPRGAIPTGIQHIDDICGEWEVVSPDQVNDEGDALTEKMQHETD